MADAARWYVAEDEAKHVRQVVMRLPPDAVVPARVSGSLAHRRELMSQTWAATTLLLEQDGGGDVGPFVFVKANGVADMLKGREFRVSFGFYRYAEGAVLQIFVTADSDEAAAVAGYPFVVENAHWPTNEDTKKLIPALLERDSIEVCVVEDQKDSPCVGRFGLRVAIPEGCRSVLRHEWKAIQRYLEGVDIARRDFAAAVKQFERENPMEANPVLDEPASIEGVPLPAPAQCRGGYGEEQSSVRLSNQGSVLRTVGSLWFAAVLLMVWLVGLACATVFEMSHGAERTLDVFYRSEWHKGLLAGIGVNVLAAMLVRFPYTWRQTGFVLAHLGILVTLVGAGITDRFGVNGRIAFDEGESVDKFEDGSAYALSISDGEREGAVELDAALFAGDEVVDDPDVPPLVVGELRATVAGAAPDSGVFERVVDDSRAVQPAVEVSLSSNGATDPVWLFADESATVGGALATFVVARSAGELAELLGKTDDAGPTPGLVRVVYSGREFEVPLPDALAGAVAVGDTGVTIHVLRYMPHALVVDGNLVNTSDRPVNPAVEVEIVQGDEKETRYAFSKFPELSSMHGRERSDKLNVTFVAPQADSMPVLLEVISGPAGEMHVRFNVDGNTLVHKLEIGVAVDSPWSGLKFAVLRRFEHARLRRAVEPISPPRERSRPALLVELVNGDDHQHVWLQRGGGVSGETHRIGFGYKPIPLGFTLRLDKAHTGHYPGSSMPRTYESHVTIIDPAEEEPRAGRVSMNRPVVHGGYAFFQTEIWSGGSVLSVARDPGQTIAFAGYGLMFVGMVVVLGTRISDRRRMAMMECNCGER